MFMVIPKTSDFYLLVKKYFNILTLVRFKHALIIAAPLEKSIPFCLARTLNLRVVLKVDTSL